MNNIHKARNIFQTCLEAINGSPSDYSLDELKAHLNEIRESLTGCIRDTDLRLELFGGEVRIISESAIDEIQQEELSSDLYILGCFNAWFLADVLEIDQDVIESMQEAEAFEALGKLVLSLNKLEELQSEYVSADGYGHHFNHYDGNEYNSEGFYIFRTN